MTTYGTFDDIPLAQGADVELAAADTARQIRLYVTRNAYIDLARCTKYGLCWWCGGPLQEYAPLHSTPGGLVDNIPACAACKRQRRVEVRDAN
jgi:hypothetical protein